ncbi:MULTISPECIES: YhfC family glutamic-type intramembrane protease [unclassified Caballeronia]|uniref:YhfC family glutamic-type intramembrane protease n=1 Tax=unclassified Caballeronia TaxID=2646786 RepID=UPI00285B5660|nr:MULTISPECIES: YhfC family glutamic-type intramembrane protease [unclassified Caballeronia]MDR5738304.1 YhfC family glutamic-type intramembrane protease [Caballeronia sp. LZ016]MDR5811840.1 YhfC family glutamic-type intramembrane protease [Caballeronia sp. LZ019]
MISIPTIASLVLVTLVIAAMPIVLYRRMRPRFGLIPRDAILGIAVFALFAMVIERALHGVMLGNAVTSKWLANPVAFVVYGALAAGVCEEAGRFLALRWLIRREPAALQRPGPGLGYGIGHGGAEAWIVGVLVQAQWIVYAVLANNGTLDSHFESAPLDAIARIHMNLMSLSPASAAIFLVERASAFVFQLGFSALMWQMLRERSRHALALLVAAHALVGLPAALFQARLIPLVAADAVYLVLGVIVAAALVRYYRRAAGGPRIDTRQP